MNGPLLGPATKPIVLVVDDIAANRDLLEGHLDRLGYDVRHAADGVEALEAVEHEEPDLVFSTSTCHGWTGSRSAGA